MSGWLAARRAEAWLALLLLTRLPAPRLAAMPPLAAAVWAYPLVGLVVGTLSGAALLGALALGVPPVLAAGGALGVGVLLTGGLHEDGLADVADGFGGGGDRNRKLAIMRDSRIGSYGTLALVLVVGLRWQAIAHLAGVDGPAAALALAGIAAASRASLAWALTALPPARPDGLGHAAARPAPGAVAAALALGAAALAVTTGWAAPALLLVIAAAALAMGALAVRQIGGQTGDVLGAMQQAAETSALIALATAARGA